MGSFPRVVTASREPVAVKGGAGGVGYWPNWPVVMPVRSTVRLVEA